VSNQPAKQTTDGKREVRSSRLHAYVSSLDHLSPTDFARIVSACPELEICGGAPGCEPGPETADK
jgi:hypothetical protein